MKKRYFLIGILLIFYIPTICFYYIISNNGPIGPSDIEFDNFDPIYRPNKLLSLNKHDPILIKSNSEFNLTNGISGGIGTVLNPYIIENWQIFVQRKGNGIEIVNTTANFIIRQCAVWESKEEMFFAGIKLVNVTNARIENTNTYSNGWSGFYINNSRQIEVFNNYGWYSGFAGIYVTYSNSITIKFNNVSNSGYYGIGIPHSNNITISDNTVVNSGQAGIELYQSHYNLINENFIKNNNIGVDIYNSTNNILSQTYFHGNFEGIKVNYLSNYNQIINNHVFWSHYAISIDKQSDNIVLNNTILDENPLYFDLYTVFGLLSEFITVLIVICSLYYWYSKRKHFKIKINRNINEKDLLNEHKEIMQKAHDD